MTPKDFTRGRLLFQRFLEFLEQPHVLDGDHGLIGEGFEQLDLRRGEGTHLDATCGQCPNEFPLLTKGNDQVRCASRRRNPLHWEIVLLADVGNVERAMLAHPAILWLIDTDLDAAERVWDQNEPAESLCSPSRSRSTTSSIPQTRAALSTMASSTGCTSVGERLMMPSTSAVAV